MVKNLDLFEPLEERGALLFDSGYGWLPGSGLPGDGG